jgi:hypothetical protein
MNARQGQVLAAVGLGLVALLGVVGALGRPGRGPTPRRPGRSQKGWWATGNSTR